jgi:hypothetical protein
MQKRTLKKAFRVIFDSRVFVDGKANLTPDIWSNIPPGANAKTFFVRDSRIFVLSYSVC